MNLRHAAALALVVWYYLMVPPITNDVSGTANGVQSGAPLSQWRSLRYFATESECETEKARAGDPPRYSGFDPRSLLPTNPQVDRAWKMAGEMARCILGDEHGPKTN